LKTGKEPGNSSPYLFLPDQLTIVIDLNSQGTVYYRLYTEDENTAASGLLSRGANFVIIPGDRLFLKSAQHVYTLSLKTGEKTIQKKIIIDVASDPADTLYSPLASSTEENRENPKQANKRVYEVSMFIDGRFIESRKKIIDIREKLASSTNNKEPYPILFNPRYPVPGTNPAERAMALSPFTLGFMAYKLIHDKAKANKQEKLKRRERMDTMRTPVIKRRFLKKQGLTDKIEVNVTISLEVLE